jgi:hypothetical protein
VFPLKLASLVDGFESEKNTIHKDEPRTIRIEGTHNGTVGRTIVIENAIPHFHRSHLSRFPQNIGEQNGENPAGNRQKRVPKEI